LPPRHNTFRRDGWPTAKKPLDQDERFSLGRPPKKLTQGENLVIDRDDNKMTLKEHCITLDLSSRIFFFVCHATDCLRRL
jgi:hypothetical protein